jgi:hypothetical protein
VSATHTMLEPAFVPPRLVTKAFMTTVQPRGRRHVAPVVPDVPGSPDRSNADAGSSLRSRFAGRLPETLRRHRGNANRCRRIGVVVERCGADGTSSGFRADGRPSRKISSVPPRSRHPATADKHVNTVDVLELTR